MSTPYVGLSDADTAELAFWGQDKWRQLRDNQTSHEERIAQLLAQNASSVVDDFLSDSSSGNGVDTAYVYETAGTGVNAKTMVGSSGDHVFQITTINSAQTDYIRVRAEKLAFRLNQDMALFLEMRTKDVGAAAPNNLIAGFSANPGDPSNESDCIAFFKASSAGKYRFRVAKGGVQSETDNISISNRATWQKLRIEITRSGGGSVFQVAALIDGAAISGSPFTTNIPDTTVMRLVWGQKTPASGTMDCRLDRWECRWTAIPVNS